MASSPPPRLILASGSPARRDLLARAGIAFDIMPAAIDEPTGEGFSGSLMTVCTPTSANARTLSRLW